MENDVGERMKCTENRINTRNLLKLNRSDRNAQNPPQVRWKVNHISESKTLSRRMSRTIKDILTLCSWN